MCPLSWCGFVSSCLRVFVAFPVFQQPARTLVIELVLFLVTPHLIKQPDRRKQPLQKSSCLPLTAVLRCVALQ